MLWFLVFLLVSPQWIQAQEDGSFYLDSIEQKYAGLKDYTTDVNVHFDIETFKAPDLQAKLHYKAPDKMKTESKRVFFFPREGGYFNPSLFKKDQYEIRVLELTTYDGSKAVKLRLTPKKAKRNIQDLVLTIDMDRNLIRETAVTQFNGREIRAVIEYGRFGGFELPTHIILHLDIPSVESNGMKEVDLFVKAQKRVTGTIEITYSGYKVNSGLSDEFFEEKRVEP